MDLREEQYKLEQQIYELEQLEPGDNKDIAPNKESADMKATNKELQDFFGKGKLER